MYFAGTKCPSKARFDEISRMTKQKNTFIFGATVLGRLEGRTHNTICNLTIHHSDIPCATVKQLTRFEGFGKDRDGAQEDALKQYLAGYEKAIKPTKD